ncbi:hypothetical protein FN846DRAFT_654463 [Sphaerosporella brunnea]|uniref:Uncharacterized protein n=1 Tax=Sphaerosporella brunnea TaxID=1250544 RepID=A0A5J5F0P9_9PEZI|nr:hypothetical protein FN846DRAFT_654463 [Sphaerosporella brunnea]
MAIIVFLVPSGFIFLLVPLVGPAFGTWHSVSKRRGRKLLEEVARAHLPVSVFNPLYDMVRYIDGVLWVLQVSFSLVFSRVFFCSFLAIFSGRCGIYGRSWNGGFDACLRSRQLHTYMDTDICNFVSSLHRNCGPWREQNILGSGLQLFLLIGFICWLLFFFLWTCNCRAGIAVRRAGPPAGILR